MVVFIKLVLGLYLANIYCIYVSLVMFLELYYYKRCIYINLVLYLDYR
jgi:hypothetical protein